MPVCSSRVSPRKAFPVPAEGSRILQRGWDAELSVVAQRGSRVLGLVAAEIPARH